MWVGKVHCVARTTKRLLASERIVVAVVIQAPKACQVVVVVPQPQFVDERRSKFDLQRPHGGAGCIVGCMDDNAGALEIEV